MKFIRGFWEQAADDIHAQYATADHDFGTLQTIFERYRPTTLLDVGCGDGRLFALYLECGLTKIVGIDVSESALRIAQQAFPSVELRHMHLEELDYTSRTFDLCVCNRVLQHIPQQHIESVIEKLCRSGKRIYVNELTGSDRLNESFFMRKYDYPRLFAKFGFATLESGQIGKQTYFMFGYRPQANPGAEVLV